MKKTKLKLIPHIVSWLMQLTIVIILGYAAFLKLTSHLAQVHLFTILCMEPSGRFIIGFLEATACVLLLLPSSSIHGAVLAFGIMLGALIAHCTVIGFSGSTPILAIVVLLFSSCIIYLRRLQVPSIARMIT